MPSHVTLASPITIALTQFAPIYWNAPATARARSSTTGRRPARQRTFPSATTFSHRPRGFRTNWEVLRDGRTAHLEISRNRVDGAIGLLFASRSLAPFSPIASRPGGEHAPLADEPAAGHRGPIPGLRP